MADAHVGYPGSVSSAELADWLPNAGAAQFSVDSPNSARVLIGGTGSRAVTVKHGTVIGDGILDIFDDDMNLNFGSVSSGSPDRWDMVVLRRTWSATVGASTSIYTIIPGNANRSLPSRNNNKGVLSDQPIALCRIRADNTNVQEVVDLRCWAHNGGVYAVDNLVKSYLDQPGTHLTIGRESWVRTVNNGPSSSDAAWVSASSLDAIRLFGATQKVLMGTPAGDVSVGNNAPFFVQAGTTVQTSDGQGYGRITFPKPFPHGLLTIQAMNGDHWASGAMWFMSAGGAFPANNNGAFGSAGWGNRSEWVYAVIAQNPDNDNVDRNSGKNRLHRINWIAIGW